MKDLILTSAILFTLMTVLVGLFSVSVIAQEATLGTENNNNMTGTDNNNMTGTDTDEGMEPEAGMISRKD
jgi:hypothetical protein